MSNAIFEISINHEPDVLISKLEIALKNNCFEDIVQFNPEVIRAIVTGAYKYNNDIDIPCIVVKDFLNWFKSSTNQSQKLIISNIISKLSTIRIEESEPELPF